MPKPKPGYAFVNEITKDGKTYVALRSTTDPTDVVIKTLEERKHKKAEKILKEEKPVKLKEAWGKLWQ